MSVLIRGMEMPKSCWRCLLSQLYDKPREMLVCKITHEEVLRHKIDGNCPLFPVPPHGRLIDADARVNVQMYNDEFEDFQTVNMSIDDLLDSSWIELEDDPTIIPAEESET